ncbi:hypothetical protein GCM10010195_26680 [Kitasatospora griseola]|nr:hypothetical protein GCM10010195_26680 [Kitasatospora griseola]
MPDVRLSESCANTPQATTPSTATAPTPNTTRSNGKASGADGRGSVEGSEGPKGSEGVGI